MSEPVEIRRAEERDLDAVLAIEAAWPTTPKWSREHFIRELSGAHAYFCVLTEGWVVVGYAVLWLLPPEAQVTTLAIRTDRARRGHAGRLMRHLHCKASKAGCSLVTLEVSASNFAAIRLYEKLGYKAVGRRPEYYKDRTPALLMNLELKAGCTTPSEGAPENS